MRRLFIYTVLFLVTYIVNINAQVFENTAIKLGGVVAFQVNNQAPRLGLSFGISKDIISWDNISITSELSYVQKGYSSNLTSTTNGNNQSSSNNKLEYLSLLVFGRLRISGVISDDNTYLICGISNNYFITSRLAKEDYEKVTFGLLAGIGGEINISAPFKIILEFTINKDLTRATKNTTRELRNITIELKSGIKF
ncbi:MAG: hypothetical protein GXX85_00720 [Ignavibacteria bacterium]|nr:hypothetical protein [Ignavibacteria bacterium]